MDAKAFLGLDIGGTSVKGIRLEADGRIALRAARATPQGAGASAVLAEVAAVLGELAAAGPVASVGVGTPGAVDAAGRVAGEAVNIPGWRGTDLRAAAEAAVGLPVSVRNDANLAAYAEWAARRGASRSLLFVGLGTGIGGGFIEDGRILGGTDDRAAEIGHLVIRPGGRPCPCGRLGCVEAYAAGPAIAKQALELAPRFPGPLAGLVAAGGRVSAREVYEAFARGDPLALAVHGIAEEALAHAIGAALALLAPDTVVLGGGVLAGAGALVGDVAAAVPTYVYPAAVRDCRFEKALLGPDAGILGAALLGASSVLGRGDLLRLAGS
ncbi:MAG: ROK family protein, partial [Spirochaetaceae bacterium]|nr:ROK family protein [Spirochaetaceae bacterium]